VHGDYVHKRADLDQFSVVWDLQAWNWTERPFF